MTLSREDPPIIARREIVLLCSSRGCRDVAVWGLRWNNPKLHVPERRKTWLACDAHRERLQGFLKARGFLRETVPVSELPPAEDPGR